MNESEEEPKDIIKVGHEKLSADGASTAVISPCCGAVSLFLVLQDYPKGESFQKFQLVHHCYSKSSNGTTRNSFEGKKVIQLEYEAYTPMAEAEIKKICMAMRKKWPSLKHIAVHHRLGVVPLAEASVIIAVSSPHRKESLDAVQYCIDTLKATVPIWKKEVYEEEEYSWKENKECFWKQQGDLKL